MAINQNHLFEELEGIKCAIVEKNASPARVAFLKKLLEHNHLTVVIIPSPPPKAAPAAPMPKPLPEADPAAVSIGEEKPALPDPPPVDPPTPAAPETFTIGVTDVTFNPTNAIFGRLLHTEDGHVVTLEYWQEKASVALDDIPYFGKASG